MRIELLTVSQQDDGDDEPVDSQHPRHNYRDDVSHHKLRVHDSHGPDAHPCLCRSVRRAAVCNKGFQ